jgi:hypothetical protein
MHQSMEKPVLEGVSQIFLDNFDITLSMATISFHGNIGHFRHA